MTRLSHLDESGNVRMIDVTGKEKTFRIARAEGFVEMQSDTLTAIEEDKVPKGNVFTAAKIAGIQAAKRTAELVPLCHPLGLSWIDLQFTPGDRGVRIEAVVKTKEATGVEMEALTAVSVAALTIYDMCKSLDQTMSLANIRLLGKEGGKSDYVTDYRPRVGIIVLSDSVYTGKKRDRSGQILRKGFAEAGCPVEHMAIFPDGSEDLEATIRLWIEEGVELIVTSGGTGLGQRDLTISIVEKLFESRLPGVEQALHAYGRSKIRTAMLSRLVAGAIGETVVVCIPGSTGAAEDALKVLIPVVFHAYPIMKGEDHG